MDDLKTAVQVAQRFVETLIPEAESTQLEEIERDGDAWIVTLSFARKYLREAPQQHDVPLVAYNVFENRTYKRLRIEGGEVASMTIREPSGV